MTKNFAILGAKNLKNYCIIIGHRSLLKVDFKKQVIINVKNNFSYNTVLL